MYQRGTSSEASATLFRETIALVDLKRYDWKRFEPALKQLWQGAHDGMVEHLRTKLEKYRDIGSLLRPEHILLK